MQTRRNTTKHTLNKADLLDQKWVTYFLAIVLISACPCLCCFTIAYL